MFKTLLIANRGEIACRIARTARAMGLRTVAIHSDADADALHVSACDAAIAIGPAPVADSYLRGDTIIQAALASAAEAIHPGYGFLSENAGFASACAAHGLIFVGPSASAIAAMGSKAAAKALMETAGVPLVPGYHGDDQSDATLAAAAADIGFPVLLKASTGGGGRGMRVVDAAVDLEPALAAARREAVAAFGDGRMLVEKYLIRPRHVELQVFGDQHGNVMHLFERDCSVQRRHQKVVEEAPAPNLDQDTRHALGEAAVTAARAIGYAGAGTVEFILDDSGFYFIEMNTRLQVEHPVTEMVTGIDLVEWQLRVAAGEALPMRQDEITLDGHAFEARLYAEDPVDFRPQTGRIHYLHLPAVPARVDTGVREGDTVSVHYDSMIAKLIVHGRDRDAALMRLAAALDEIRVAGVKTNQPFLARLARHPDFVAGRVHTGLIEEHTETLAPTPAPVGTETLALAGLVFLDQASRTASERRAASGDPTSPWDDSTGWRLNEPAVLPMTLAAAGEQCDIVLSTTASGYSMDGTGIHLSGRIDQGRQLRATVAGHDVTIDAALDGDAVTLFLQDGPVVVTRVDRLAASESQHGVTGRMTAPMPGRITALNVTAGDYVVRGAALVVLDAMKMEHSITAPEAGLVTAVHYALGDLVDEGADLLDFETATGG